MLDISKQTTITEQDELFMRQALNLAKEAALAGEVPVGCIIVENNVVIAEGFNDRTQKHDPTGHAEIVALRQACAQKKYWRLPDATLYVTLEPCLMCAGAIMQAHLKRIVFGAFDAKNGACGSHQQLEDVFALNLNHHTSVTGGVLSSECGDLLRNFFLHRREQQKEKM